MLLSILIPTYNRPMRLLRLLHHLVLQFQESTNLVKKFDLEIIIADGSDGHQASLYNEIDFSDKISYLKNFSQVKVLHRYGNSLHSRLRDLFKSSSGDFILLLGDDDLVILENLYFLLIKYADNTVNQTITGRLVNIRGLSLFGLRFDTSERPYSGVTFDNNDPIVRLSQYFTLNALGTNCLAYSIQSRNIFSKYVDSITDDMYFGGLEMLHQVVSILHGVIVISDVPLIFRDFTYLDYKIESMREAPDSDPNPYFGKNAVDAAVNLISSVTGKDNSSSLDLINNLNYSIKFLQPSRLHVLKYTDNKLTINIPNSHISVANTVWRMYLRSIYSKKSRILLFLLMIPGSIYLKNNLPKKFKKIFKKFL